ncbi:MAG: hypothetical protein R2805_11615 [Flavobacterium sp.]|uniref:hypothetical protein n=1 Tax=Flavobacterium sp. TaxID=239 RepID=UPI003527003D
MQGKKNFTPQLFVSVNLVDMVPADNFYRRVANELDLHFLRKATKSITAKGSEIDDCFLQNLCTRWLFEQ